MSFVCFGACASHVPFNLCFSFCVLVTVTIFLHYYFIEPSLGELYVYATLYY